MFLKVVLLRTNFLPIQFGLNSRKNCKALWFLQMLSLLFCFYCTIGLEFNELFYKQRKKIVWGNTLNKYNRIIAKPCTKTKIWKAQYLLVLAYNESTTSKHLGKKLREIAKFACTSCPFSPLFNSWLKDVLSKWLEESRAWCSSCKETGCAGPPIRSLYFPQVSHHYSCKKWGSAVSLALSLWWKKRKSGSGRKC